jgi:hypothetical protein
MTTNTAPAGITAEQLAEVVRGRSTAVIVQDATGTVATYERLDRVQLDDPDVIVLLTRDEALAVLAAAAREATARLVELGVIV